ncbi:hypothetical protein F7725_007433 [Dissostichus mawsoni]|uniref:Uncharacterized protein n=1 Tax=Dissostichus mawsoni TaxID=36200 RepID=A0A7J5XXE0_DISMA|nr:hypothetical protein F7725_007433 [Dissostichus mawsoni]
MMFLEQKHDVLDKQKTYVHYTETLEEGKRKVEDHVVRKCHSKTGNGKSTETEALLERTNLLELKAKLKKEREDLDRESEVMNKENWTLICQVGNQETKGHVGTTETDIKREREKLEVTKTDLQVLKEHERIQFDE